MTSNTIRGMALAVLALALAACAPPTGGTAPGGVNNTPPVDSNHDGSSASPVTLTVDTAFSGKIGADGSADQNSYYRFNTGSNTSFELILTDDSAGHTINGIWTQLAVTLLDPSDSDNDRSGYLMAEGLRPVFDELTTNHNYTIVLRNDSEAGTYQLKVAPYSDPNEGSAGTQASLALDSPHEGTASNAGGGRSYFSFNTGTNTGITFDFDVHGLTLVLYSNTDFDDPNLTGWKGTSGSSSGGSWTKTGLTAGTTYYLLVSPGSGLGASWTHSVDYTLTLSAAED